MANSVLLFVCVVTTAWQFGAARRSMSDEDVLSSSSTFQLREVVAPHVNTGVDPNRKRIKPRAITGVRTQELVPMEHATDGNLSMHGHVMKTPNASISGYHTALQEVEYDPDLDPDNAGLQSVTGGPSVISSANVLGSFSETIDKMQRRVQELTSKVKSESKLSTSMLCLYILCLVLGVVVTVWLLRAGVSALLHSTKQNADASSREKSQSFKLGAQGRQSTRPLTPFTRVKSREWGNDSRDLKRSDQQSPARETCREFVERAASKLSNLEQEDEASEDEAFDQVTSLCQTVSIGGTDGTQRFFKWMHSKDAMTANLPVAARAFASTCNIEDNKIERIAPPWSVAHLESILKRHNVQVDSQNSPRTWSAETCSYLVNELSAGRAMLVKQGAQTGLYCMIEIVLVTVLHVQKEASEVLVTDMNDFGDEMPYVVKHSDENVSEAAERCLREKLDGPTGSVKLNLDAVKTLEHEEHSAFYPGLVTIIRKHITKGSIEGQGRHELCPGKDKKYPLHWKPLPQVNSLYKHRSWLVRGNSASKFPSEKPTKFVRSSTIKRASIQSGGSREVVLPWTMEEVNSLLESHHIDSATLGRSLENLSQDASAGLFYFARFADERHLFLVRDIVSLQVVSLRSKLILVESAMNEASQGHQSKSPRSPRIHENDSALLRWPQETRLYHDSVWETARKIVRQQLVLEDDVLPVSFDSEEVLLDLEEARGSQCSIINRQTVVTAHISQSSDALGSGLTLPTVSQMNFRKLLQAMGEDTD